MTASSVSLHNVQVAVGGRTLLQLRNEARQRSLKGRSAMNKAQLEVALAK